MTYNFTHVGGQPAVVQNEVDVFNLFSRQHAAYGRNARAMIVTNTFRDCDAYLDAGSLLLSDGNGIARRTRGQGCVAEWEFKDGATLRLDYFPSMNAAHLYAARDFSFMAFHDPATWHDLEILRWFLSVLRSHTIPTKLVTVKSPLVLPDVASQTASKTERVIDYSAITKAVSA